MVEGQAQQETSVMQAANLFFDDFQQTARRHMLEESILHDDRCKNLRYC
jgi:hypothetical protein